MKKFVLLAGLLLSSNGWAWRFEDVLDGTATSVNETTMYVLAFAMPISIICFIISLWMCLQKKQ